MRRYRILRLSSLVLCGALGFATSLALNQAAFANHDCAQGNETLESGKNFTNGRGVRAAGPGMRVSNTTVSCIRYSVIQVTNTAGTRAVTLGWYEDPSGTPRFPVGDPGESCPATSGTPAVVVMKLFDGVFTCDTGQPVYPAVPTSTDDAFRVHDHNQDGNWEYYRNSTFLGFYGLGSFVTGPMYARAGRYSQHGDSMYANFDSLDRMNTNQAWLAWDNGFSTSGSPDPDYRVCFYGTPADHVEIKLGNC